METKTYELAGFGERLLALIIDGLILGAIGGVFGVGSTVIWSGGILSLLLGVGYQWYFLTRHNGQTPGKMIMNIRIIKVDGTPIADADAVLRYVGYYISSIALMLGFLWALIDPNNQGWHDKIANTYVVKVPAGGGDARKRKNEDVITY